MRRVISVVVGVVLCLLGALWIGQGTGNVQGSPMTGHSQWTYLGAVLIVVGVVAINVNQIYRGNFRSAYLGFYTGAPFAGKGYMSEGLRLVVRHAFRRLGLHRLEANIQPGNRASIRLVGRCGFRREGFSPRYLKVFGRWRDHERWAITAEDLRR